MKRFAAALAVAGLIGLSTTTSSFGAPDPNNNEALQRVGACIAGGGEGDILLLVDTSGSLMQSDPTNARVSAAKYLVSQLNDFSATNKTPINVSIAGFSGTYAPKLDWTKLGSGTNTVDAVLDSFAAQNTGADTDYWTALTGARKELAKRSNSAGTHCPMLVVFTDGENSIEPRGQVGKVDGDPKPYAPGNPLKSASDVAAAMKAAEGDLCRPTGLADQLRSDGITTVAVGLSGKTKPDFALLRGLSVGTGGTTCGALTKPSPGAFFEASNIDELFFAFDQFATPGQRPITQDAGLCAGAPCPGGTHSFVVDTSIGRVHGLATSTVAAASVILRSPSGKLLTLGSGDGAKTGALPGATVGWSWVSPQTLSFDLKRSSDKEWTGQWSISFVAKSAAGRSQSSLHLFGDIAPVWANQSGTVLRTGQTADIKLGVTRSDGKGIDPASLGDKTVLKADLVTKDGKSTPVAAKLTKAAIAEAHKLDLGNVDPGPAVLRLTLNVTTNSWKSGAKTIPGTTLEPQVKDYAVTIQPPASYPQLPARIDLGTSEGDEPVSGRIPLTGAGCGWLAEGAKLTGAPSGVTAAVSSEVSAPTACASGGIPITVKPSGVGNGLLAGTVTVMVRSNDAGAKPVAQQVDYRLEMQRPVDKKVFYPLLIGLTLLGLAIPLALLYAVRYATTKLQGNAVAVGSVRGPVNEEHSFLSHATVLDESGVMTVPLSGQRSVNADGKVFTAKMSLSPTEPGRVVVEQPRTPAAGEGGRQIGGRAVLPLALANTWMVSLDAQNPHSGDVEVTFLTTPDRSGWSELIADAATFVPDVVRKLRAELPAGGSIAAHTGQDDWGSGGSDGFGGPAGADPWGTPSAAADPWGGAVTTAAPPEESPGTSRSAADRDPWA